MIDQKELRKGNLVSLAHESNIPIVSIKTIEEDNVSVFEIKGHFYDYELLMPVELTPEWLERFDFKLKEESSFENIKMKYWVKDAVCLFFNDGDTNSFLLGYGFSIFDGKYFAATLRWINQLHILQNSFHSLTGKELEITNP